MKNLLIASSLAALSFAVATGAEAACRQVYGGTSCNWLGQCWHNPPKTICDAPAPRPAPIAQPRPVVQPGGGGRLIGDAGSGLISNKGGGLISDAGSGLRNNRIIGNDAGSFRR